jgi:hypothetical protein
MSMASKSTPRKKKSAGWKDRAAEIGQRIVQALRGPTPVPVRVPANRRRMNDRY